MGKKLVKSRKLVGSNPKRKGVVPESKRPPYMKKGARYYEAVDALSDNELGRIVDNFQHPDWRVAYKILTKREHDRAVTKTAEAKSKNNPQYTTKNIDGVEYESFARFDQDSRFETWRQAARYRKDGYGGVITNAEEIKGQEGHKVRVWKSKEKLTDAQMQTLLNKMRPKYMQVGYDGYAGICRKCDRKIKEFIHEAEYSRLHYGSCGCESYAYEDFSKGMHGGLIEHEKAHGG